MNEFILNSSSSLVDWLNFLEGKGVKIKVIKIKLIIGLYQIHTTREAKYGYLAISGRE